MTDIKKTIQKTNVLVTPMRKMYGYKPEIVEEMNEDKPYPILLSARIPKGDIKQQMKENHPKVKRFEIPVIFKNEFQYACLGDDYFDMCVHEICEFIENTYDIEDEDQDLCDIFVPEMMEPERAFKIDDSEFQQRPKVDLRNWIYTSEEKPVKNS